MADKELPNTALDTFLKGDAPEPDPAAEPETEAAAAVEAKPETEAKPDAAKPEAEADEEPEPARDGEPVVPRRALEDERHKRQDWKAKAVAAETRMEDLQRQLEEAKRPPPDAAVQPVPREIPNPAVDPAGYHAWSENERVKAEINQRLNFSEMLVTKELGAEKVAAIIADFKEAAKANPSLTQQLYSQPHPYEWAAKQVDIARAQREIGTDPAAYRAKIIAEFQAANPSGEPVPRVSPAAGQAPSLASARSAAPRSAPAFTGPPSLDDIVRRN